MTSLVQCKYLDNKWASTKSCVLQFKGRKSANKKLHEAVIKAKGYADLDALVESWTGSDEFVATKAVIDARASAPPSYYALVAHSHVTSMPRQPRSCAPYAHLLAHGTHLMHHTCMEMISSSGGIWSDELADVVAAVSGTVGEECLGLRLSPWLSIFSMTVLLFF